MWRQRKIKMKKQKLPLILTMMLGILFLAYFYGCRKEENKNTVSHQSLPTIKIDKKNYEYVNLTIRNQNPNTKDIGESYTVKSISVNFATSGMQTLFNDVKSYFSGDIQTTDSLPKIIVLFAPKDSLTNIQFDSVKAISIFIKYGDAYLQKFYSVSNGHTTEDTTYSKTFTYFNLYNIDMLFKIKINNKNIGWALFQRGGSVAASSKSYTDYNNFGKVTFEKTLENPGDCECASCEGGKGYCGENPDGVGNEIRCQPDCNCSIINHFGHDNNLMASKEEINLTTCDNFRDSLLINSTKGQDYIKYYYQLSTVTQLFKPINTSNFTQYLNFAYELVDCATKLQSGKDTDIPISSQLKSDANDIIATYAAFAPDNKGYQDILTQIKNDLDSYVGKSRSYILNAVK